MTAPDFEKLAEEYATKIAGGPLHDQAWHYVKRDFLAGARAMQEAAAQAVGRRFFYGGPIDNEPVSEETFCKWQQEIYERIRALMAAKTEREGK